VQASCRCQQQYLTLRQPSQQYVTYNYIFTELYVYMLHPPTWSRCMVVVLPLLVRCPAACLSMAAAAAAVWWAGCEGLGDA
jgi:hypothetical protein